MNNTSTACDTFAETFTGPNADGKYVLVPDCNPWTDGPGSCPDPDPPPPALCSRRVIIIPIVDGFGNGGSDPTEIQGFALLYLEGYDGGKCQGSNCEIKGHFVRAEVTVNGLSGVFDPESSIQFTKLVE
jgi:hypothetical protein